MVRLQSLFQEAQDTGFQDARPIGRSCRLAAFSATLLACTLGAGLFFRRMSSTGSGTVRADLQSITGLQTITDAVTCTRPKDWCAGSMDYVYTTRDCDGDGAPDPFCQKPETSTCGCLQSSNSCFDTWPAACPDLESTFDLKVLPITGAQVPIKATVNGTLMYKYVMPFDKVLAGANLFSIVDSTKTVHEITSPADGKVLDVAKLYPGDAVYEVTRLAVIDPSAVVLSRLTGPGVVHTAIGYEGHAIFKSWAPSTKMGWWVPKDSTLCTLQSKAGKELTIKATTSGMVNNMQTLKYGDGIEADADLVKLLEPTDGGVMPLGLGQKKMLNPDVGKLMEWEVNPTDLISKGDPVATMKAQGETTTATWDGPPGMVVARGKFSAGDVVAADSEMLTVQGPLPKLPLDKKSSAVKTPQMTWLRFDGYNVSVRDKVKDGDTVAMATPIQSGYLGDPMAIPFQAAEGQGGGYIDALQDITPGTFISPGNDLCVVGPEPPAFNWWLLIGALLVSCLLLCLVIFCCKKEEKEPEPVPMAPEPVVQVEERELLLPPEPVVEPEPVVAPVEENPVEEYIPPGVPIYFDKIPYYCLYKPLGISFHTEMPIRIDRMMFNSYGKTLGLEPGMTLTRIADEDLEHNHHISVAEDKLSKALEPLPWWPLHIDFKKPNGEIVGFDFVEHPLGIQFTKHLPIKIAKFNKNSYAQSMGVEIGWEIVQIADEVESYKDSKGAFNMVNDHLHEGMHYLPTHPGSKQRESDSTPSSQYR